MTLKNIEMCSRRKIEQTTFSRQVKGLHVTCKPPTYVDIQIHKGCPPVFLLSKFKSVCYIMATKYDTLICLKSRSLPRNALRNAISHVNRS